MPHAKLMPEPKLPSTAVLALKREEKSFIRLSNSVTSYWLKKTKRGLVFNKTSLKIAINHLIENCYFNVGTFTTKQSFGIPMGINPAPFLTKIFL